MRQILNDELIKEYELIIDYCKSVSEKKDIFFGRKKIYSEEMVMLIEDFIESMIKESNYYQRKRLSLVFDRGMDKKRIENSYKEHSMDKIISETKKEILELNEKIMKKIKRKYEYKIKLDNSEIFDKDYKEYINDIFKEEIKLFSDFMLRLAYKLAREMRKISVKLILKDIFKCVVCVLTAVAGLFMFKKIKNITKGTKNIALVLGKKTTNAIKEHNCIKEIENTKAMVPQCIYKSLDKGVSRNIL